jgi:hypothetical protein
MTRRIVMVRVMKLMVLMLMLMLMAGCSTHKVTPPTPVVHLGLTPVAPSAAMLQCFNNAPGGAEYAFLPGMGECDYNAGPWSGRIQELCATPYLLKGLWVLNTQASRVDADPAGWQVEQLLHLNGRIKGKECFPSSPLSGGNLQIVEDAANLDIPATTAFSPTSNCSTATAIMVINTFRCYGSGSGRITPVVLQSLRVKLPASIAKVYLQLEVATDDAGDAVILECAFYYKGNPILLDIANIQKKIGLTGLKATNLAVSWAPSI